MTIGSNIIPGAIIMVNNDLSNNIKNMLITQLHIDESITGQTFDLRLAANPNYSNNIRAMQRRLLVIRDLQDINNRTEMDVVIFIKNALASIVTNCFGIPGATHLVKNLYWGQLCIYNTLLNRSCQDNSCNCLSTPSSCDGYCDPLYYPAAYDPEYPAENHSYNVLHPFPGTFGYHCPPEPTHCLCRQYICSGSSVIPSLDCRLVKKYGEI